MLPVPYFKSASTSDSSSSTSSSSDSDSERVLVVVDAPEGAAAGDANPQVLGDLPAPPAWVESVGESDDESNDEGADSTKRAECGQFVWPCPRQYAASYEERWRKKQLKPEDLTKEELLTLFRKVLDQRGKAATIKRLHAFDEPHKRINPVTDTRERHKHLVFKLTSSIAHLTLKRDLEKHGVYGQFSFRLTGYAAYLSYMLKNSAKKLQADIDRDPSSWPHTTVQELDKIVESMSKQMAARNQGKELTMPGRGRKRSLLTFSEFTDVLLEHGVQTEQEAWAVAKQRKLGGDDTMWNSLDSYRSVGDQIAKALGAWQGNLVGSKTFMNKPKYPISEFFMSQKVGLWVMGGWKSYALIIEGPGGAGKTAFCCAVMFAVTGDKGWHFISKADIIKKIRFEPGQGIIFDELCLVNREVDDVKCFLDLENNRWVSCRNEEGFLPAGAPRIFAVNHRPRDFWPREAYLPEHQKPIKRRHRWEKIQGDLRRNPPPTQAEDDEPLPM